MDRLLKIKEKNESKYPLGDEYERGITDEDVEWLIKQIEKLQSENERYKNINQGLLEVQFELRNKEREYNQWFEAASDNIHRKEKVIENQLNIIKGLESEIEKLEEDNYDLRIESGNI